jgi:hypothetical protein
MFNIRKKNDTIISTVPTSTARQLATVLLENIKLKEALKTARDFDPSLEGPIPNSKPVNGPKGISQLIKDTEDKQGAHPQQVAEKNADIQRNRIEMVASKMMELDKMAIESQKAYRSENGFTLRSAGSVVLPIGCPTKRIQALIGEENTRRMDKGLTPYLTYDAWNNPPTSTTENGYTWINASDLKAVKVSKSVPTFLVSQKYYVLRDAGTTYIYNNNDTQGTVLRLMKQVGQHPATDNANRIIVQDLYDKPVNLTDTDHADIIKACPSYEDLLNVYVLCPNVDELEIDFGKAVKLFQC